MITKDAEYNALRAEILNLISIQNTYIIVIAMYTITITILGIGLERENNILFLLPYTILFSFQRIIAAKREGYLKIAAYIAVYLEEQKGWKFRYKKIANLTYSLNNEDNRKLSMIKNIFSGRISSLQLGLLCSFMSILMCLLKLLDDSFQLFLDGSVILFAIILFVSLCYFNKDSLKTMQKREEYIQYMAISK